VVQRNVRAWVRYPASLGTSCEQFLFDPLGDLPFRCPIQIRDISRGGLSFFGSQPFELGAILVVELPTMSLLARVAYVRREAEGTWVVGSTFARDLGEEEVQAVRGRHAGLGNTA
jgi:hypothetical protein